MENRTVSEARTFTYYAGITADVAAAAVGEGVFFMTRLLVVSNGAFAYPALFSSGRFG
ncbi:hypothetical protein [uncultured Tateyamaria sp.]|uniref:hypothetical protein n=1 Tax=uncultured Tateyamaria sp. TaxID=455651 RepID=UPI0026374C10|nr:hypothetical protein [uncultured Tateyamaria sp.]